MISAREALVTEIVWREREGMPKVISHLTNSEETFSYDPSTESHLTSSPLLRDPYEARQLAVRESSIQGAGRGVFTRRNIRY